MLQSIPSIFSFPSSCKKKKMQKTKSNPQFCYKKRDRLISRVCCDKTGENGSKANEGRVKLNIRKKLFTLMAVKHNKRLPREVVDGLWGYSRSGWAGLWATFSSCRCLCSLQGSWTRWSLRVPSNSNNSMILWFEIPDKSLINFLCEAVI